MYIFDVYSKLSKYNKRTDNYESLKDGSYILLEEVQEWYGDANRGLAIYMHEELSKYVESIQPKCSGNMIKFTVNLYKKYDEYDTITYDGKECTLKTAICKDIEGQISDGWGENGKWILDVRKDAAFRANLSWDLYERDYKKSMDLAEKSGERFGRFEKYPVYKKIEL